MTQGIRISSLSISAFRGINATLDFDLSAPLTLIYAPNGTGKTTMCEAAEWLLTGQVERLKDGKDFNAEILQSAFSEKSAAPHAAASLHIAGKAAFLSRTAKVSQSSAQLGGDAASAKTVKPNDLLARLAPAAAADEAHPLAAISLRQRWLKGTRFLNSEDLAALVDTDEATIERRTQVFADLLGIRHLLDAEKQLLRYADELAVQVRATDKLVDKQDNEIRELETSLARGNDEPRVSARSEAGAANELLGGDGLSDEENLDDALETLTVLLERGRHSFTGRLKALREVEAAWSTIPSLEEAIRDRQAAVEAAITAVADLEGQGHAAAADVGKRSGELNALQTQSRVLASARDALVLPGETVSAVWRETNPGATALPSIGQLSASIPESRWEQSARDARRADLGALRRLLEGAEREADRLGFLSDELAERRKEMLSEAAFADQRRAVAAAEDKADAARRLFEAAADPLARLQAAASDLLAHDHDLTAVQCPACAHDWGTSERLRAAIEAAAAIVPGVVDSARKSAETAAADAAALRAMLERGVEQNARIAALEGERAALLDASAARQLECDRLGLADDISLTTLDQLLERLRLGDALAQFADAFDALVKLMALHSDERLDSDAELPKLLAEIDRLVGQIEQRFETSRTGLAAAVAEAQSLREARLSEHSAAQKSLAERREELTKSWTSVASLQSLWRSGGGDSEWSEAGLKTGLQTSEARLAELARAEGHIAAARASWEAERQHRRLADLKAKAVPERSRRARMTARIEAARRAGKAYHDSYTQISRDQIQALSRVINPLFARMHANRIFDRIDLGEGGDFLHWLADAGDQQLDPGRDFSQGQRQDLALAVFLARARSLGGTFFLDEPVVHLDDLNRVGLLDILRATVLEGSAALNLVITTSSRGLARHVIEKFARVDPVSTPDGHRLPLKVIELDGNGRIGVKIRDVYPVR